MNKKSFLTLTDDLKRALERNSESAVIVSRYGVDETFDEERARLTEIEKKFNDAEQKKLTRVTLSPLPV